MKPPTATTNAAPPQFDALLDHVAVRLADLIIAHLDEQMAPEPKPALLDTAGLARELRVSAPTIAKLRRNGCPVVWVIESPRYELAAVLDFLRTRGKRA
jgi:hypothetical protein